MSIIPPDCPRHSTFCTVVVVISHHQTSTRSGADQWQLLPVPISAPFFRLAPTPTLLRHRSVFKARVRAMGIRDRPTSFRSPWQNGLVERLIGSARRECTDHVIVFNEEHLRRILSKYARYYNEVRTHLSFGRDAPCTRPIEWFGDIIAYPILGGLHHRYARI